jgi:hypothetical protein
MKHFAILLCLHFYVCVAQAQSRWSADLAVGTHGIGTPLHNSPTSRGGAMFTGELNRNIGGLEDQSYFKLGLNISFYNQKGLKSAVLVMPTISCRLGVGNMFIEPSLALGYAGSFLQRETFTSDGNGNYQSHRLKWLSGFAAQPRLRLGARVHEQFDVYAQYALRVEGLYHAIPVLPMQSVQIGTSYRFK